MVGYVGSLRLSGVYVCGKADVGVASKGAAGVFYAV